MNKQEVIEEVKTLKPDEQNLHEYQPEEWEAFKDGFDDAKCYAELAVEKLDEPEKPVLSKEEAEWIDKLTDFYSLPDALYYIVRCGYGYLFVFEMAKKTYELPVDSGATYGEFCKLKERLVNAVIYGYEVEKEKLYIASFRDTDQYLGWNEKLGEWFMSCSPFTSGVEQTQETWEGVGIWNNPAFEIKEVEDD